MTDPEVAAELRRRIRAFDERVQPPADLFARVSAARPPPPAPSRPGRRWARPLAAAVGLAAMIAGIVWAVCRRRTTL